MTGWNFSRLRLDVAFEFLRAAAAHRLRTLLQYRLFDVGHGQRLRHAAVQFGDDLRRHAGRREQPGPADHDHARIARFGRGRRVGKLLVALAAERGEQIELSRFHEIRHAGRGRERDRNLSAQHVGDRRRLPPVGHVRHLDVGGDRQQHAHQMGHVADAERAVVDLAGIGLGALDEILDRLDPGRGIDHRAQRVGDGLRDRGEVAQRVVGQLLVDEGVRRHRADRSIDQRVAVGRAPWRRLPFR